MFLANIVAPYLIFSAPAHNLHHNVSNPSNHNTNKRCIEIYLQLQCWKICGIISFYILIVFCIFADVNECTANTHNCHPNADCTNTNGGFTCACKSGFSGSGTSCAGKI